MSATYLSKGIQSSFIHSFTPQSASRQPTAYSKAGSPLSAM